MAVTVTKVSDTRLYTLHDVAIDGHVVAYLSHDKEFSAAIKRETGHGGAWTVRPDGNPTDDANDRPFDGAFDTFRDARRFAVNVASRYRACLTCGLFTRQRTTLGTAMCSVCFPDRTECHVCQRCGADLPVANDMADHDLCGTCFERDIRETQELGEPMVARIGSPQSGTRAVTWSVAAERKQEREHPAHIDNYMATHPMQPDLMVCTRECEECGNLYTYVTDIEEGSPDDRGIMSGVCEDCEREASLDRVLEESRQLLERVARLRAETRKLLEQSRFLGAAFDATYPDLYLSRAPLAIAAKSACDYLPLASTGACDGRDTYGSAGIVAITQTADLTEIRYVDGCIVRKPVACDHGIPTHRYCAECHYWYAHFLGQNQSELVSPWPIDYPTFPAPVADAIPLPAGRYYARTFEEVAYR